MSFLAGALGSVISAITPTLVSDSVQTIKDWYNEKKLQTKIDDLYRQYFGEALPDEFNTKNTTFDRAKKAKPINSHSKYGIIANEIVEAIDTYIKSRSKRYFWSKGKNADPLHRFLYEWRRWAIEELAGFEDSPESDSKIDKRLNYLYEILTQKSEYFQIGVLNRENNKFNTFEKMKKILDQYSCLENRKSINIMLSESLNPARKLYASSLKFCYLAADTKSNKNSFLQAEFYDFETNKKFISNSGKKIYSRLYKSYKGSILKSILELSFLNLLNTSKASYSVTYSAFYASPDKFISKRIPTLDDKDPTSFPWSTKETETQHLVAFQNLGRDILNISELTYALELAIKQTADAGNVWAKGAGEEALLKMMEDYNKEMIKLQADFELYFDVHSEEMRGHFDGKSGREAQHWAENFRLMKIEYNCIVAASYAILGKFKLTQEKLMSLPENISEDTVASLALYNQNAKRNGLPVISLSSSSISDKPMPIAKERLAAEIVNIRKKIGSLKIPIQDNGVITIIDKPIFETYNAKSQLHTLPFSSEWNEHDSYQNWMEGFTSRNRSFFKKYHAAVTAINNIFQPEEVATLNKQKQSIEEQQQTLAKLIEELNKKIDDEAPRWKVRRFGFILLPVRLGRPFNRKARNFANLLKHELGIQVEQTIDLTNESISFLNSVIGPEIVLNSREQQHTQPSLELQSEAEEKQMPNVVVDRFELKKFLAETKSFLVEAKNRNLAATSSVTANPVGTEIKHKPEQIIEEMKIEEADEPFDISYENLYNKFLTWKKDKSSPLTLFPNATSLQKYLEQGLAFKNQANPLVMGGYIKAMGCWITSIQQFINSLSEQQKDFHKVTILQLQAFTSLLSVLTITDPALHKNALAVYFKMGSNLGNSNIQHFGLFRGASTTTTTVGLSEVKPLKLKHQLARGI